MVVKCLLGPDAETRPLRHTDHFNEIILYRVNRLSERLAPLRYHGILEQPAQLIIGRSDLPHPRLHVARHSRYGQAPVSAAKKF